VVTHSISLPGEKVTLEACIVESAVHATPVAAGAKNSSVFHSDTSADMTAMAAFTAALPLTQQCAHAPLLHVTTCPRAPAYPALVARTRSRAVLRMGIFDALKARVTGLAGSGPSGSGGRAQTLSDDPRLGKYVKRVERINELEDAVEKMSAEEMVSRIATLREEISAAAGETDGVLEEVFALVREASFRVLGLRHYDVQLVGGMVLNDGKIAEMATGEGKTLVAALPSALNALAGQAVCIVTVNDYLAKRDSELIGQIHRFLGFSVGLIQAGQTTANRRKAYSCDITYVTNSELGFDYLRDNLALTDAEVVMRRPFGFCLVDECDSILIDEARTPLIISGRAAAQKEKYGIAAKAAAQLEQPFHYTVNEKEQSVLLTDNGFTVLESALGVTDLFDVTNPWAPFITNALKAKEIFLKDVNYIVREEQRDIQIVDEFTGRVMEGRRWSDGLHQAIEAKEGLEVDKEATTIASVSYQAFFKLFPNLAGMTGTAETEANELYDIYGLQVLVIPTALPIARKDYEDVVYKNAAGKYRAVMGEIARVAPTGRPVLVGTTSIEASEALSALLTEVNVPHDVLNAKPESALRESEIIAQAGRKYSITIATNMAGRGTDILLGGNSGYFARALARKELVSLDKELYNGMMNEATSVLIDDDELPCEVSDEAFEMLASAAEEVMSANSPTTLLEIDQLISVAAEYGPIPEDLGAGLTKLRQVLCRIQAELADTVAEEREEVIKAGGLYVIGTERAESRRVDNQLRGRAGRQGDPGGSRFFLALDDRLFRIFGGDKVSGILNAFRVEENIPIESKSVTSALDAAQRNVEEYYAEIRKQLFTYDEVMSTQRAAIYAQRRRLLSCDDAAIKQRLADNCAETALEIVNGYVSRSDGSADDFDGLAVKLNQFFPGLPVADFSQLETAHSQQKLVQVVQESVAELLLAKENSMDACSRVGMARDTARFLVLTQMDNMWQSHMKSMDYLKEFVVLRAYSRDDPLAAYKTDGFELFEAMLASVRRCVCACSPDLILT
jgi:preprotein translocase subunit SecA